MTLQKWVLTFWTPCTYHKGVDREVFFFQIGHGQKMFHLTPHEQICTLKKNEGGKEGKNATLFTPHPVDYDTYYV